MHAADPTVSPAREGPADGRGPGTDPGAGPLPWRQRHGALSAFVVCFVVLLALLVSENRHLFGTAIHEDGDDAANSIIIQDAKNLRLLHGNYSRVGFNHPGPADFYVQAAGESLFHDLLGLVPAPFNGQVLAMLGLNALLLAAALALIHAHTGSASATALALGVLVWFTANTAPLLSSTWMPYVYFAPFLLLLVAAASVATGRTGHLWALALAGGLLVNGHVEFFLFVPVLAVVAIGLGRRPRSRPSPRRPANERRDWILAAAILGLLLAPIAANTVLHWPGEFDDYLRYTGGGGRHSLGDAVGYVSAFWSGVDGGLPTLATVGLGIGAVWLAFTHPVRPVRRLLATVVAFGGLATVLLVVYAVEGIDRLSDHYVGYFYWAVPGLAAVVVAVGLPGVLARRTTLPVAWVAAGALTAGVLAGSGLVNEYRGNPSLPTSVDTLAAVRPVGQKALVVALDDESWPDVAGVVVQAARSGVRACVDDPRWKLIVTARFICSQEEVDEGPTVVFRARRSPPATEGVLATFPYSTAAAASP